MTCIGLLDWPIQDCTFLSAPSGVSSPFVKDLQLPTQAFKKKKKKGNYSTFFVSEENKAPPAIEQKGYNLFAF